MKNIEVSPLHLMALMNLASFCGENDVEVNPRGAMAKNVMVLRIDFTQKLTNAVNALKELDTDESTHPLIGLPRDGVRWSER